MNNEIAKSGDNIHVITKVHGFRFWCQKVIPLVFDDSLSYYEVLCKLTHLINEFAETLNTCIDGILELEEAFNDLKDEVDETLEKMLKLIDILDGCYRFDLTLDSGYVDNAKELSTQECEKLKEILNEMIINRTIKPIYLTITDFRPDTEESINTMILLPSSDFINNIMEGHNDSFDIISGLNSINLSGSNNIIKYGKITVQTYSIGNDITSISDAYFENDTYTIQSGGSGGSGLPTLTVGNFTQIRDDGELTVEETAQLSSIINTMIDNQIATPIIVQQRIDNAGLTTNDYELVGILNTDSNWLSKLLNNERTAIEFVGIDKVTIDYLKARTYVYTINFNDYSLDTTNHHIEIVPGVHIWKNYYDSLTESSIGNMINNDVNTILSNTLPNLYKMHLTDINNPTSDDISAIEQLISYIKDSLQQNCYVLLTIDAQIEQYVLQPKNWRSILDNTDGYHSAEFVSFKNDIDNDASKSGSFYMQIGYNINDGVVSYDGATLWNQSFQGVGYWDVEDRVFEQSVRTTWNEANRVIHWDSSVSTAINFTQTIACDGSHNTMQFPDWYPMGFMLLLLDTTDNKLMEIDNADIGVNYSYAFQDANIFASYRLDSTNVPQLTDGHDYKEVLIVTWKKIHEHDEVDWFL